MNIATIDWKFWIGDVLIPVGTFILGFILGKWNEKKKNSIKVKGDNNHIYQDVKKEK